MARRRSLAREYIETLLVALVVALFARTFFVQAYVIPSPSMEGNLLVGDHILVNKLVYSGDGNRGLLERLLPVRAVRRGDIVVFHSPENPRRDLVKRVVALAGDRVALRDKRLEVNGRAVDDAAYTRRSDPLVFADLPTLEPQLRRRDNFGPYLVPVGHVFCLGDNRDDSNDSRFFGPVPEGAIKGRALLVFWSARRESGAGSGDSLVARILVGTRWERSLTLVR